MIIFMHKHIQIVEGAPGVKFIYPNQFQFTLPNEYKTSDNDRVSLKSLRLYYSWRNVTTARNNNQFSYIWTDGSTHVVTLKDGIWSYRDFAAYLHLVMQQNGHYLMDADGKPVFYIHIDVNSVFYRISLTCATVPTSLPTDWTAPVGFVFPASPTTPQLIVPNTKITRYLGFDAGTYPATPQSSIYQVNGARVPQVTDISSLQLQTNLTRNEYGPDIRTLATFNVPPGAAPGAIISEVPFYQDWIPMQPRVPLKFVELFITDQIGNPVILEDIAGFACTLTIDGE